MKKLLAVLFLAFGLSAVFAQAASTPPQANLTWSGSPTATAANPGTVNIYRATVAAGATCPVPVAGGSTYTVLTNIPGTASGAAGTYSDATVAWNTTYCYAATPVISGQEGPFVGPGQAVFPAQPPTPAALTGFAVAVTL